MAASRRPGPMCSIRNPVDIDDGTSCRQASPLQRSLGMDQRSLMTPAEQLAYPEKGLEDDEVSEFVVFLFAEAAMAVVKGIERMGFRELLKLLTKREEKNLAKAVDYFDPVTKTYPNSPYKDLTKNPMEMAEAINQKIVADLEEALGSRKIAKENLEIGKLHQEYIKTGKWKFEGLDDLSFPDEDLMSLRQKWLRDNP